MTKRAASGGTRRDQPDGATGRPSGPGATAAGSPTASETAGPGEASSATSAPFTGDGTTRVPDPRAVRVSLAPASSGAGLAPIVVEPPGPPVAPVAPLVGATTEGGHEDPVARRAGDRAAVADLLLVDGEPVGASLTRLDDARARLELHAAGGPPRRVAVLFGEPVPGSAPGTVAREVVVDGWRVLVEIESERRASLRERARRGGADALRGGPTELRAIIPGRVLSVSVAVGDAVEAGQQLLVVEAMKMQNELRAPREGTVGRIAVEPGRTIELGDLLLVLE